MSPLKVKVLISDHIHVVSATVCKPTLGPSRMLNIYLQGPLPGIRPTKIGQYMAAGLVNSYGLIRMCGDEAVPVAECATLVACQAVALSDYLQYAGLETAEEDTDL